MKNSTNSPRIPQRSISGSTWNKFSFEKFASDWSMQGKPYSSNVSKILFQLLKNINKRIGFFKGSSLFCKSLFLDMIFNKPKWQPEKFTFNNERQEKFYKKTFREYLPFIIVFENLAKKIGKDEADKFIAAQMLPIILHMMKSRFHPVEKIDSVETWLKQARDYLGTEIEKDKGFEGDIYLADDKTEMRFHVTRCANMEVIRKYGLPYTAAACCMGDHITYHTVFPNLIFKRTHSIAVGDCFCDHEFRLRTNTDPILDEENYGDCRRIEGIRELVAEWEEKAKEIFFGSKATWEEYSKTVR
ncbi:MAG: L-2-amino-thiazoline-4-carboxylic acid hydrolase [bacterium]|nr:L-2-amino-thiazoline-4-carboxylic acid hydrolase [bacterium]